MNKIEKIDNYNNQTFEDIKHFDENEVKILVLMCLNILSVPTKCSNRLRSRKKTKRL